MLSKGCLNLSDCSYLCIFQVLLEDQTRVIHTTTEFIHHNQLVIIEMCSVVFVDLLLWASVNNTNCINSIAGALWH